MKTSSRLRRLIEGFPDLDRPYLVEGEFDDQRVRASFDSKIDKIGRIDEQGVPGVLGNHMEAIILGTFNASEFHVLVGCGSHPPRLGTQRFGRHGSRHRVDGERNRRLSVDRLDDMHAIFFRTKG
jgi:hypothetical protein